MCFLNALFRYVKNKNGVTNDGDRFVNLKPVFVVYHVGAVRRALGAVIEGSRYRHPVVGFVVSYEVVSVFIF